MRAPRRRQLARYADAARCACPARNSLVEVLARTGRRPPRDAAADRDDVHRSRAHDRAALSSERGRDGFGGFGARTALLASDQIAVAHREAFPKTGLDIIRTASRSSRSPRPTPARTSPGSLSQISALARSRWPGGQTAGGRCVPGVQAASGRSLSESTDLIHQIAHPGEYLGYPL